MCDATSLAAPGGQKFYAMTQNNDPRSLPPKGSDARAEYWAAQDPNIRMFQWQKQQAAKAEADAMEKRRQMEEGLGKINSNFAKFDDEYFDGIKGKYLDYANPQIDADKSKAEFNVRSGLANRGKLGSSSAARAFGEVTETYGGIYRDATAKSEQYANDQRANINAAKQGAIGQMYASESQDAGLQAATNAVQSLSAGPAFEPVTALLAQAAKYAQMDYNNSVYNGQSYGLFSPITNRMAGSSTSNGQVKTIN